MVLTDATADYDDYIDDDDDDDDDDAGLILTSLLDH